MRLAHMTILLLTSLCVIACDVEGDNFDSAIDAAEEVAFDDEHDESLILDEVGDLEDANGEPVKAAADLLNSGGHQYGACSCYTTCSSNGSGWTKTYYVGPATGQSNCSVKAASFCKGKSSTYKYHNSACT